MRGIFLILILTSGCSINSIVSGYIVDSVKESQENFSKSKNYQLLDRAFPVFIVLLDNAIIDNPDDCELLLRGAQINTGYALAFVESKDPKWASEHYKNAKDYAFKALELKTGITRDDLLGKGKGEGNEKLEDRVKRVVEKIEKDEIDYLFWLAMSWGSWINVNRESVEAMSDMPFMVILMEHVLKLDKNYQNGLPLLFFGAYYGGISKTLGGDPEKSKKYFEEALALNNREYLMVQVLYARTYCVNFQDRTLFENLLDEVLEAKDSKKPDFTLSNELSRRDAKELLDKEDQLFISSEIEERK